jgi:hypothetical protein
MTIRAYAVVCAKGKIHQQQWKPHQLVVQSTKAQAEQDKRSHDMVYSCGPHKVITLRGEVSGG